MSESNGRLAFSENAFLPDDDGAVLRGEVDARPGVYPETSFEFVPMYQEDYETLLIKAGNMAGKRAILLNKLRTWSCRLDKDTPAPIDEATLAVMKPQLLVSITNIVIGMEPPTKDDRRTAAQIIRETEKN